MNMEKVARWIAENNIDALESAWLDELDSPPLDTMRQTLDALVAAGKTDSAQTLVWMLVSETVEQREPAEALEVVQALLPAVPGTEELRNASADLYRQVHGQADHFDEFMRESGLLDTQSPRRAIRTLDTCLALRAGEYLANRFEPRVVRMEKFDPVLGQFELVQPSGERTELDPKRLADEFDRVDESDFRVLCTFRGDGLGKLLADEPAAVLIGICRSRGGQVDTRSLKDLLVPRHLESGQWSGWWSRARSAAKRSAVLSLGGRNPTVISHHPDGRSLEQELAEAVAGVVQPLDYLSIIREYAREVRHRRLECDVQFIRSIISALADQAESFRANRPADALDAALVAEIALALAPEAADVQRVTAAAAMARLNNPVRAIADLRDASLWPTALAAAGQREDAGDLFEELLVVLPASQLDAVAKQLCGIGRAEAVARTVTAALTDPVKYHQVCLWLWRGPSGEPVGVEFSTLDVLSRLLTVMQEMNRDTSVDSQERRSSFQQIRSALIAGGCRTFRGALQGTNQGVAATLKRRIEQSPGLSGTSRDVLLQVLREEFHTLFVQEKVAPWLDETVIWTTEQALHRQEAALKELIEVTLPANSKAIGAAADLGDLSENSEWQYAIEEQRRLKARVAKMQGDLGIARILQPEDVPADTVGIGSRVTLKHVDDGSELNMTILGPWDGDVAARVFNYKTALAQSLMGQGPGYSVTLKLEGAQGEYSIDHLAVGVHRGYEGVETL